MNPKIFFGELKRRNVYKVAVAYAVAGWAFAEGHRASFPGLRHSELGSEISTLTQLLQMPRDRWDYTAAPVSPAFLSLDLILDPLRADPAFQKLCDEKQP